MAVPYNNGVKARWTGLVIGIFILIAPWLFGFSEIVLARWGNVLCGLILILMNVWAIYGTSPETPSSAQEGPDAVPKKRSKNNKSRETNL